MIDDYEEFGYTFKYPFRKYKIPEPVNKPTIALTKEQLIEIRDIELEESSRASHVRNIFMISFLSLEQMLLIYMILKNPVDLIIVETRQKKNENLQIMLLYQ